MNFKYQKIVIQIPMTTPSEVRSKRTHHKKCGTLSRGKNKWQRKDFKAWIDRITGFPLYCVTQKNYFIPP